MTNGDWVRSMTNEQLADWLEGFAEAFVSFWITPHDQVDWSRIKQNDYRIQLNWLNSEYSEEMEF